jgi:broad specificity phosphatase PhoE
LRQWRETLLAALAEIAEDAVLVSHFIPINVAVGQVRGDDRVVCFQPDNCSCTMFDVTEGRLTIAELGAEAPTRIL